MHILIPSLAAFFLLLASLSAAPILTYCSEPGLSPFSKVEIQIEESGETSVSIRKLGKDLPPYQMRLSTPELGALETLVRTVDFFRLPENEPRTGVISHAGESKLFIKLGAEERTLEYGYRPPLDPLSGFLWKMAQQAIVVDELKAEGNPYSVMVAVSPLSAGPQILQPYVMKEPLLAFVQNADDRSKVANALVGLAWLTTPEEFLGIIANEAKRKDRESLILACLPVGNGPKSHVAVLCDFFYPFVRDRRGKEDLSKPEEEVMYGYIRTLGDQRYAHSIPMFLEWFKDTKRVGLEGDIYPLASMGVASLYAIMPLLDSEEHYHRANAIELLQVSSRSNPKSVYSNPVTEYEYQQMIPIYKEKILPKLRSMAAEEASEPLRMKASAAIEEIEKEISR